MNLEERLARVETKVDFIHEWVQRQQEADEEELRAARKRRPDLSAWGKFFAQIAAAVAAGHLGGKMQ